MTDSTAGLPPLRIVALVKQIPVFEEMRLGAGGRLERAGLPLEMSAYCRRAVAQGVELARATGGTCTVMTLGPPSAEDVLREAIAFGADDGVLISDPAFAGSDTLATARALAAAIELLERRSGQAFDLVLVGLNSVDADTGQVGPEVAQLLDLAFAAGVKRLSLSMGRDGDGDGDGDGNGDGVGDGGGDGGDAAIRDVIVARAGLEHDDTWVDVTVRLPAVLSTAERLIDPCKIKDPAVWATVDPARINTLSAADLGPGPWGQAGSPTSVGETRAESVDRAGQRFDGPVAEQVVKAVRWLADRGVLHVGNVHDVVTEVVPSPLADLVDGGAASARAATDRPPTLAVLIEPDRRRLTRELLSGAARVARARDAMVVALGPDLADAAAIGTDAATADANQPNELASWGADALIDICSTTPAPLVPEDVAAALARWARSEPPWALLVGGTAWGREVASRVAASLGAGLTGDAVGFAVEHGRLVAWKPAFGGSLVAAIRSQSAVQIATVRAGVLAPFAPRPVPTDPVASRTSVSVAPRGRVEVVARRREDNVDDLLKAEMVVGVGRGVDPAHYDEIDPLLDLLQAQLAATRKVTDEGHLPRARQVGITGHSLSPRLYVAIGTSGKYNHMVGVRSAGTILAINPDPEAKVFDLSDVGIVGDWREVVPILVRQLRVAMAASA